MTTYGFEREALAEYRDATLRYAEQRAGLGEEFIQAVETAMDAVCANPEKFQPVGDGLRIYRMKRFPYFLFYGHQSDQHHVVIYAVAHHRRRPDYWRGRVRD